MLRPEWDCPACSQPNCEDNAECVRCNCPFDCDEAELERHKIVHANQVAAELARSGSDIVAAYADGEFIGPFTKYFGLFTAPPTLFRSVIIFGLFYIGFLGFAIPLALKFKPDELQFIWPPALGCAAVLAGSDYWSHFDRLSAFRQIKWTLTWLCLGVTLFVDLLALIGGINLYNINTFSLFLIQKASHLAYLWFFFRAKWLAKGKTPSPLKQATHDR